MTDTSNPRLQLRTAVTAAAFTAATRQSVVRRWSKKTLQSTPPPLPLISLPADDDWEEFDVPTRTGFAYCLPHLDLEAEELVDASATTEGVPPSRLTVSRPKICRQLSEYMSQNELFQLRRHGFGIDAQLVYKRCKGSSEKEPCRGVGHGPSADNLQFDALFESGNLDRAYRVLGRHYASLGDLTGGGGEPSGIAANTGSASSGSGPGQVPFPYFAKADMEYDLYCDTDTNTHGHIQWYFFQVTIPRQCFKAASIVPGSGSTTSTLRVRFNIRNMLKKSSLYNDGMLPAVYVPGRRGWHHAGTNVCYFKNSTTYRNRKNGKQQNYFTLSFVYEFALDESDAGTRGDHDAVDDGGNPIAPGCVVYFAHCYPYTYTRLQQFLKGLQKDPERNRFFRRRILCKTLAGNICDVLTITDFAREDDERLGIVLTARVHPGESNSSFIMHGIIDFLTGQSREARYLRHRFVFKIVPMLNPDGVIHGNYRCSLAGTDLNRRYVNPSSEIHPTVHAVKNMVLSLRKTRPIGLYCDIHGHSRKRNMFLYGCHAYLEDSRAQAAKVRLFPHVLARVSPVAAGGFYSISDCTFSISRSKKGTGRVVVWDEAHVLNSFTLEASFYGVGANKKRATAAPVGNQQQAESGRTKMSSPSSQVDLENATTHFMPLDYRKAGLKLCLSLIPFARILDMDRPAAATSISTPYGCDAGLSHGQAPTTPREFTASSEAASGSCSHSWRPERTLRPVTSPTSRTTDLSAQPSQSPLPDSKVRLAPLTPSPSSAASHTDTTGQEECFTDDFDFFDAPGMLSLDSILPGFTSTEDILKEIEESLPENFQNDSDEDASPGSESDPSGDNMEEEEIKQLDIRHQIAPGPEVPIQSSAESSPPLAVVPERIQMLRKRFSDSQLAPDMAEVPEPAVSVPTASVERSQTDNHPPEIVPSKPRVTLAPLRKVSAPSPVIRQKTITAMGPRDRNRDIASLHLRAVQKRSKSRRYSRYIVANEEDP